MNLKMKPSLNAVCALTVFLPAICSTDLQGKVFRSKRQTDEHLGGPNTHTRIWCTNPNSSCANHCPYRASPGRSRAPQEGSHLVARSISNSDGTVHISIASSFSHFIGATSVGASLGLQLDGWVLAVVQRQSCVHKVSCNSFIFSH